MSSQGDNLDVLKTFRTFCPLLSVICPPSNLTTATTCSNNDITVNWDQSPESGVSYTVRSHGDDGTTVNYTTTQTSQVVTGLQCGEMYMFSVAASDAECTSVFSQPIQAKTGQYCFFKHIFRCCKIQVRAIF